jgi:hypothetical protein
MVPTSREAVVTDPTPGQPPARRVPPPDDGGAPVCWLDRVCPECGRLDDGEPADRCPGCGAALDAG